MELDELTDLTVDNQKDELQNLSLTRLRELKEAEERNTALDNIERELGRRKTSEEKAEDNEPKANPAPKKEETNEDPRDGEAEALQTELEQKVDYIIQHCKTTSIEGFENYKEEN